MNKRQDTREHKHQRNRRKAAAFLAGLLAVAMLFVFVLTDRDLRGLHGPGGSAGSSAQETGAAPMAEQLAALSYEKSTGEESLTQADADTDGASGASTDKSGAPSNPPSDNPEAASTADDESYAEAAKNDIADHPERAAASLNAVSDTALYESTLRTILDEQYEGGASAEELAPFTSYLDDRGQLIAGRYERAYEERTAGLANGYVPEQILLSAPAGASEEDFNAQLKEALPGSTGSVTSVSTAGDAAIAAADLPLEWSVQDAASALNEYGLRAQPNYFYQVAETDAQTDTVETDGSAPADADDAAAEADTEDADSASPATQETTTPAIEDTPAPADAETAAPADADDTPADTETTSPADEEDTEATDHTAAPASTPASGEESTGTKATPAATETAPAADTNETKAPYDLSELFSDSESRVDLTACWDLLSTDHKTVRVGVLDTGLFSGHTDLDGALAKSDSGSLLSGDYVYENGTSRIKTGTITERDTSSHGTHVCGIIAAKANGKGTAGVTAGWSNARQEAGTDATPVAELVVVGGYVEDDEHNWGFTTLSLQAGIDYLTGQNCRIINLSLGGPEPDDKIVVDAMQRAADNEVLLVIAAGNEESGSPVPYCSYPAWYPWGIAVINAESPSARDSSSNYGPDYDIAAPGVDLWSTHAGTTGTSSNYALKTGTSMAAPVVTGIAAMMLYEDPSLTVREIKNILYATAGNQLAESKQPAAGAVNTHSAYQGSKENSGNQLGFGYVDPVAAIKAVQQKAGTSQQTGTQTYADYLELSRTDIDMERGEQTTLEYRLLPATAKIPATSAGQAVTWTCSDETVATVSKDGIITAKGVGICTITATCRGAGNDGRNLLAEVTVNVECTNLKYAKITALPGMDAEDDAVYTGKAQTPAPKVILDGTALKAGSDYTVSYKNNTNAGTATVTVTGIGHYRGTKTATFKIQRADIASADSTAFSKRVYTGKAHTPGFTLHYKGMKLVKDKDYTVTYTNNIKTGKATITVKGIGNYAGTKTLHFTIGTLSVTPAAAKLIYNGKVRCPDITVKYYDPVKKKTYSLIQGAAGSGADYALTKARGRVNVGIYKIKVTLQGSYSGSKTVSFRIIPKGTKLASLTAKSKAFKVTWDKQTARMKTRRITGYQIQWSTSPTFAKNNHTWKRTGYKTTSVTINKNIWRGMKGGTKYYVRVRTYRKLADGTCLYSKWSSKKSVRTKK